MKDKIQIETTRVDFSDYYIAYSISKETQEKLSTNDFIMVPSKNKEGYFFSQETIDFTKFCRQNNKDYSFDILTDSDIKVLSLHSFDIWLPVIYIATEFLLLIVVNLVSDYVYDKLKGREKDKAEVNVSFIVKREDEEKTIHYSGDAETFKETFDKIDLNKMWGLNVKLFSSK